MDSSSLVFPDSLYNFALSSVVVVYSKTKRDVRFLPENLQFDVYYKLYKQGRLCQLGIELCELDVFSRILKVTDKRLCLYQCFQALMDHGVQIASVLAESYVQKSGVALTEDGNSKKNVIQLGFALGGFLSDAGWFLDSERVFLACLNLCKSSGDTNHWTKVLECCICLLHVKNAYCKFNEADQLYDNAISLVKQVSAMGEKSSFAALYAEFSSMFFDKSHYDKAYYWSLEALKEITPSLPTKTVVDVLCQTSKACVVKRNFKRAELVIKQAVCLARDHFGLYHPKYADVLLEYGFYLLNIDLTGASVQVYQTALDIHQSVFGGNNLLMATAHEDLAYASYVYEYSSGKFSEAQEHAEKALQIMKHILPEDHLLLASSKRVTALILEEIAIDNQDKDKGLRILEEAEVLHLSALYLAQSAFGEMNIQTAKHYGNLGRLYQSMKRYQEAEQMHLKAISIKETLLGPDDYEVALSAGHLASLYNYDMGRFADAEKLYLRSIAIAKKQFGDGYSGLEYDYRGLLRVHTMLGNHNRATDYTYILHEWKQIRDKNALYEESPLDLRNHSMSTTEVIELFFKSEPFGLANDAKHTSTGVRQS